MDGLPPEASDLLKSLINNHPYIALAIISMFGIASLVRAVSALLTEIKDVIVAFRSKSDDPSK